MEQYIILIFTIIFGTAVAPTPNFSKKYRTDYEQNRKTNAFYKMHTEATHYFDAKQVCEMEGAHLMTPNSQDDIVQVHGMFKRYPDLGNYVWVGDDGLNHESAEETPIIDLQSETTEYYSQMQCDVLTRSGEIETSHCSRVLPFVCKVDAKNAFFDTQCGVYGTGYKYCESSRSCYKVPELAMTWDQAYAECRAQGAHLLVLNSELEQRTVKEFLTDVPRLIDSFHSYYYHCGIRANKPTDGSARVFRTIFNETLEEAGYSQWAEGEPNNYAEKEYCGTIFLNDGKYNDVNCNNRYGFICEKENRCCIPKVSSKSGCQEVKFYLMEGYKYYKSTRSCYKVPNMALTWDQAYAECRAHGAHLLILNSKVEQQTVTEFLKTAPRLIDSADSLYFHCGFRANKPTDGSARVFRTIFNETLEAAGFSQWAKGEPSNYEGTEYCGSIFQDQGKYNDLDCNKRYGFICEKEVLS